MNECNCREMWKYMCAYHDERLNYMDDDLNSYPALHGIYFEKYFDRRIISMEKNDEVLYKYISKNNFLENGVCYHKLANKLCIEDSKWHFNHEYNVRFLIDYLVWSYGRPDDGNNFLIKKTDRKIIIRPIENKYKKINMNIRVGQNQFRKNLIQKYGHCQICGLNKLDLLKASHSKPWNVCNEDEAIDIYNGFLFCDGHDGLYDKGYITFDDAGNIIVSKALSEEDIKKLNLNNNIKIKLELNHKEYLEYHRQNIFKG